MLPEGEYLGGEDIALTACMCDSRRVRPGHLFAALPGERVDGHDFIVEAVARGASGVLLSHPLADLGVPQCVVANPRAAYGRVCQALAGNPSHRLKLIGVTGTNGKTTTTCLIAGILTAAKHDVGLLGTLGYSDGCTIGPATHTTPPAEELASWLTRMVANDCSHAVMEVSSHALAQSRVAGVRFDAVCVTNVSRDHLDYHASIHDYRAAKSKLFDHLAPEGFAVVNADDPVCAGYLARLDGPTLTIGIRRDAEIMATPVEQFSSEQTFLLTAGSETVPVRTRMIGTHHIYNCLTAAAVGLTYGIDLPTVARGLESIDYVPGRLERIECGQPFSVFVDFAHTPDALTGTLRALRQVTAGRLICVFGAGGDRDRQKRPLMGAAVEAGADRAIVTSDNPRSEDPQDIIDEILEGFQRSSAAETVTDRVAAIHAALAAARPGDCVLIAGKGHERLQILHDETIPLDDREVAREWLYRVQPFAQQ
jgi:UDP-N-acetylmuramoyl-L-alanyl-D-glutamate--2,6-diaminopimelate ligase